MSLCLSIFCSFGVGQILFIFLSKASGTVYKLNIWGVPRLNTIFLLASLWGQYYIVVRSMDWEDLILNSSPAQAQGAAKITWLEHTEAKGWEGWERNRPASECFLPFFPTTPQQKSRTSPLHSLPGLSENPDIGAACANKLNTKSNITISCWKRQFTNSIYQHLLNHKIWDIIYAEKNESLIISTPLTACLGSIPHFKFTSHLKGDRGIQLQHIESFVLKK